MRKTLVLVLITLLFSFISVYADSPVEKQIEAYLAKKTPVFKIKGGGIDAVKSIVRMYQPRHRLKSWTSSYDPKTTITTFKVEYYIGNQNTAKPDVIVKTPEELKKFILGYTLGKSRHIIYLTTNNTLDPTTDSMFIVKLDYPVADWLEAVKTVASISFTKKGIYRNAINGVNTRYNHEYLPITINDGFPDYLKAFYDNYLSEVLNDIKTTSRSPYEAVYKWFTYSYNDKYGYDFPVLFDENGKLVSNAYGVVSQTRVKGGLTWYVLGEMDIDMMAIMDMTPGRTDNAIYYYEIEINGEKWYLDYTGRHFVRVKDYPDYDKIREWKPDMVFNIDEIKTYEQFKERFNIKE